MNQYTITRYNGINQKYSSNLKNDVSEFDYIYNCRFNGDKICKRDGHKRYTKYAENEHITSINSFDNGSGMKYIFGKGDDLYAINGEITSDIINNCKVNDGLDSSYNITGLSVSFTSGNVIVDGTYISIGYFTKAFTASKDTYVDVGTNGTIDYTEVSNGADEPSLESGHLRLFKVVSTATAISSVAILCKQVRMLSGLNNNKKMRFQVYRENIYGVNGYDDMVVYSSQSISYLREAPAPVELYCAFIYKYLSKEPLFASKAASNSAAVSHEALNEAVA